jgi:glucosamine kinase
MSVLVDGTYKIGVDGGGTKTELILVDSAGSVVARHIAPGCNPSQIGADRARETLFTGLEALLAQSRIENLGTTAVRTNTAPTTAGGSALGRISATHLYMAGSAVTWREIATGLSGLGALVVAPDSLPVLELATAGAPGLVLHAGTGSFVAARAPDGSVHYAGGLGWKLGDAGSGFDLGRRAAAVALLELQALSSGVASPQPQKLSALASALRTHTGLDDYAANSRFFYNDPAANAAISGFAPRVLELAERDCGPAQQVVADSVTDLARLADQVIHRLFPSPTAPVPCGVSGRILNSVPASFALRSLAEKLRWPITLSFITESPSEGVRRLLSKTSD